MLGFSFASFLRVLHNFSQSREQTARKAPCLVCGIGGYQNRKHGCRFEEKLGSTGLGVLQSMHAVPRTIVDRFAQAFAGERVGFSARQITEYFTRYSNLVKPFDHYGVNPTRKELFIESVYALNPKQQYYALNDLTWTEHACRYTYPDEPARIRLREQLHAFISPDPIGMRFSRVHETSFREDWVACLSRLEIDPASAMTAARTLLETVLRTIISSAANSLIIPAN